MLISLQIILMVENHGVQKKKKCLQKGIPGVMQDALAEDTTSPYQPLYDPNDEQRKQHFSQTCPVYMCI